MTIKGFLEDQREAAVAELRSAAMASPDRAQQLRSRVALLDWLLDGVEELTAVDFHAVLMDVLDGNRHVPGLRSPDEADDLLRRWHAVAP